MAPSSSVPASFHDAANAVHQHGAREPEHGARNEFHDICHGRVVSSPLPVFNQAEPGSSREGTYVPTHSGAASFRNVAMIESATIFPVFGFSDGTFSIDSVKRAESASTSMT